MGWNPFKDSWGLGTSDWDVVDWLSLGTIPALESVVDAAENVGKGVEASTLALSRLNAEFIREESAENVRRATLQFEDLKSQVIGIQSSSGFLSSRGTMPDYVSTMESSFQSELDYIAKSTDSRVDIALMEGITQADIAKSSERAQSTGIISDVVGLFL